MSRTIIRTLPKTSVKIPCGKETKGLNRMFARGKKLDNFFLKHKITCGVNSYGMERMSPDKAIIWQFTPNYIPTRGHTHTHRPSDPKVALKEDRYILELLARTYRWFPKPTAWTFNEIHGMYLPIFD